jgi:hypothetical protein
LIWEERNSGRYEYAPACRERVRAPRAREKTHQPSNGTIILVDLGDFGQISVTVYGWDARGIGHADGLDWAPNSVGAR